MVSRGRSFMRQDWWVATFPGLATLVTVMAINLFGDGLRDALDPKYRRR
jgi:ABC-type dipeptide/oligopeptide/nickel transport system permease subunit